MEISDGSLLTLRIGEGFVRMWTVDPALMCTRSVPFLPAYGLVLRGLLRCITVGVVSAMLDG